MLRRPCGRAMRSKGRVGVDAVASKPGVAKEVLPLTRRVLRLRLLKVGKLGEYDSLSHSRTEVRGRRGPRLNDRAPPRGSHTTLVWRSESSSHTTGPPVLLNSIIGTPGGRYMRLVTPLRAPFAAPIAPSHRGGLIQQPSSATAVHSVPARDLEIWPAFASTVADAKENLAPLLSRVGPLPMPMVVGRHEHVIKIRCSLPPPISYGCARP